MAQQGIIKIVIMFISSIKTIEPVFSLLCASILCGITSADVISCSAKFICVVN